MPWESRGGQNISYVGGIIPGKRWIQLTAGNTSSLVTDRLCDQAVSKEIAVAGLYYDFLAQQEQTITNMMGAILKQLVGRGDIPIDLREAFHKGKKEFGGRGPLFADLEQVLRRTIASIPQVFICIDALDECMVKNLPELLASLRDIVQECPKTRLFLTGRPHVKEAIRKYFTKAAVIPISPSTEDVRDYLDMRLNMDDDPEAMSDNLRGEIVKIIMRGYGYSVDSERDFENRERYIK